MVYVSRNGMGGVQLLDKQLSRYAMSTLACIRVCLQQRGKLPDPGMSEKDLLDGYIAKNPQRAQDSSQPPFEIFAELVRHYGVAAEVRTWWSWKRIRRALRAQQQVIVLVGGFYFQIPFPGLRVWSWPWRSILVTRIERSGPFVFVDLEDPGSPAHARKRTLLFLFKNSRSAGVTSILIWRYLWLKVTPFRERVPFPWMCLLIGP